MRVVTWQAPCGNTIHVTTKGERILRARGVWPRCGHCGQEYAEVSHGMHEYGGEGNLYTERAARAFVGEDLEAEREVARRFKAAKP